MSPFGLLCLFVVLIQAQGVQDSCESASETCYSNPGSSECPKYSAQSESSDIYRYGGTAQAYKPRQPQKSEICDGGEYSSLRVSTWPFLRRTLSTPPKIRLTVSVWKCETDSCCQPVSDDDTTIEVWQARPNGTYSSLRPGVEDGDCRAMQQYVKPSVAFETYAPGSTGSMGGIGPGGWDTMPYGAPSIHVLVHNPQRASTLINFPISFLQDSLSQLQSSWSDWRGSAWVQGKPKSPPYKVTTWNARPEENTIEVDVEIYQNAQPIPVQDKMKEMCRSWLYGLPGSFFLEPISVCAPSLFDFFAL